MGGQNKMILSKIYNNLSEDNKDGFVFGFVYGLVFGFVCGLVFGLFCGLVYGLVFGFVCGLVFGFVYGLVVILTNFTEALPFINGVLPIIGLILGIFILVEIFYWLSPNEKVKKKDLIKHTLLRKGESLFEVLLCLSFITQVYILIREIDFIKYFPEILKWIGYIGAGIIGLGLIVLIGYGFIKLNSLKYRKCNME